MQHILDTLTGQNKESLKAHGVKLNQKHLDITEDIKNEVRKIRPNTKVVSHSVIYSAFLEYYRERHCSHGFIEKVCEISDNKYLKSTTGDLVYLIECKIDQTQYNSRTLHKIGKSSVKNINARVEAIKTGLSDYGRTQVYLVQVNQCLSESFFFQKYSEFRTKFGESEGKTEWFEFNDVALDEVVKDFQFGKDLEPLQQSLL